MCSPSGGKARRRGGTQVGKAPPSPEMMLSGLTRGQVFGEDQVAKPFDLPRLCRTCGPPLQAGCYVFWAVILLNPNQCGIRHRGRSAVKRVGEMATIRAAL